MRRECVPSFSLQLEIFLNEESHGGATLSALWRRAKWSWIGGWVRRRRSRGRECSAMENEAYPFARSKWTTRFQWTPFLEREWLEEQKGCEVFLMAESLMAEWWRRSTMRKKPALQRALEALRASSWGYGCAFLDWVLGIRGTNCRGYGDDSKTYCGCNVQWEPTPTRISHAHHCYPQSPNFNFNALPLPSRAYGRKVWNSS